MNGRWTPPRLSIYQVSSHNVSLGRFQAARRPQGHIAATVGRCGRVAGLFLVVALDAPCSVHCGSGGAVLSLILRRNLRMRRSPGRPGRVLALPAELVLMLGCPRCSRTLRSAGCSAWWSECEPAGQRLVRDEPACRPGSVSVRLATSRSATIHLGLPLPTVSCGLPASSGGPPSNAHARSPVYDQVLFLTLL